MRFSSPVGTICVAVDAEGRLVEVRFVDDPPDAADGPVRAAFDAYFAGDVRALDALPVAPAGTLFQRAVWAALREIPAGATWSYRDLAARIGNPAATRAVGAANGANPVPLVIPCHRVIAADGTLGGYSAGLARKRWLLDHERGARPMWGAVASRRA